MTIQQALINFKALIEAAVIQGGNAQKHAVIRSSIPILNIHEAVKHQLIAAGFDQSKIFPPLTKRSPELKIAGALKKKDQDICIVPNRAKKTETLTEGLLEGVKDEYGFEFTERTISVNIRSQISSISKNFDTLYERTISEAQNMHDRCPRMVLGEVYMIAIPEYDDKAGKNKKVAFKNPSQKMVRKYIKSFHAINSRNTTEKHFYKYEDVCLLIVDFRQDPPKLYNSTQELIDGGFLPANTDVRYEGLTWNDFSGDLMTQYKERFGNEKDGGGCAGSLFNLLML